MTSQSGAGSFQFINSTDASVPKGNAVRTQIRKQAMSRAAAARKQRGNYGKHNLRQYPVILGRPQEQSGESSGSGNSGQQAAPSEHEQTLVRPNDLDVTDFASQLEPLGSRVQPSPLDQWYRQTQVIPAPLPSTGYESMRIRFDFDVLDLSALTTFHVGRATAKALSLQPARLIDVLRCKQWSYLSYLPSRYGQVTCLDDAAHCTVARVRHYAVSPAEPPSRNILSLYAKALVSLQAALNDPVLCLKPDVLCATQILAMYELLNKSRDGAWAQHAAGAQTLIRLRGPHSYSTDFEKALFLSQAGPIFTEAMLNNRQCFLAEEAWQQVFHASAVDFPRFTDRSDIVVSLWTCVLCLPSLFGDVQRAVCNPLVPEAALVESLLERIHQLRNRILQWRQRYEMLRLERISRNVHSETQSDKRYEVLGVCLAGNIILNRLHLSLNPLAGPEIEETIQSFANQTLVLMEQASANNPRAGLFMAFKVVTARAVLATTEEWRVTTQEQRDAHVGPNGCIAVWVFEHWCSLKGRRTSLS